MKNLPTVEPTVEPTVKHGTSGCTYKITVVGSPVCDDEIREMYAISIENIAAVPLWQVAREIEKQLGDDGILIGIEDLSTRALILDMRECEP